MKTKVWFFLLIISCGWGCEKEFVVETAPPNASKIDFSNLVVGQESFYVQYQSNCENLAEALIFTGDTLRVRVISGDGGFLLEESLTENSINYRPNNINYCGLIDRGDLLEIPERNQLQLFGFYGSDSLHLVERTDVKLKQHDCRINYDSKVFAGDEIGFLKKFTLGKDGEIEIRDKIVVSCIPIIEVDGYLLYDQHQLYLSHTVLKSTFNGQSENSVYGWYLLD